MGSDVLQGTHFADAQEWLFQAAERKIRAVHSCKGIVKLMHSNRVFRLRNVHILAGGRFTTAKDSRFQATIRWPARWSICRTLGIVFYSYAMFRCNMKGVDSLMLSKIDCRLRKVDVWAEKSGKRDNLLMRRDRVFILRNVQMWAGPFVDAKKLGVWTFRNP